MASLLLQIGATNAALGLAAALTVFVVTRYWRNPHLAAVLWVIVLIKFVIPPLVPLSVIIPSARGTVELTEVRPPETPAAALSETAEQRPLDSVGRSEAVPRSERSTSHDLPVSAPSTTSTSPVIVPPASPSLSRWAELHEWLLARGTLSILFWAWIAGAVAAATLLAIRAFQFDRIAGRTGKESPADLQSAYDRLCRRMEIRRVPRLRIVDAEISPLIWTRLGCTVVLLPQRLIDKLSLEQLTLVLAHEIAHIRRHDHSLRWLEAVVQSLYWWLPPVRWIRHRLHDAQEACCDARVIAEFPDRQAEYCDALLATADWITRVRRPPILASELGRGPSLKHRIEALLERSPASPLSWTSRGLCGLIGCLLLSLTVRFVAGEEPKRAPAAQSAEKPTDVPAAFTTEFLVLDHSGQPVPSGQAKISGAIRFGRSLKETATIRDGKAVVTLKSRRILQMTVELDCPGLMTFRQRFRGKEAGPSLDVAPQYKFRLTPGIKIGGRVVDQTGKPVVGARVSAECPEDKSIDVGVNVFDRTTRTSADGRWELSGAPADLQRLGLRLRHAADADDELSFAVSAEQYANLKALEDVRALPSTPSLSGVVVDPSGKPVVDAMVLLYGRNFYRDYGQDNIPKTDSSGKFSISGVGSGTRLLSVFSLDWALKSVRVSLPPKAPLKIMMEKGKRVEFHTVDSDGKPIADIGFYPQGPRYQAFAGGSDLDYFHVLDFLGHRQLIKNRTDKNGIFVWENAPSEALGYQIYQAGVLSQPGGIYGPKGSPHTLVFRRRIPVHGKVVDAATGAPIQGFALYEGTHFKVNRLGSWSWDLEPRPQLEPSGFVDSLKTLDRLIRYRVQAKGYRPQLCEPMDADKLPNEPISLEFRLEKDGGYQGIVRTPDGQPAAGATVYAQTKDPRDVFGLLIAAGVGQPTKATHVLTTTADGKFQLEPREEPFVCFISHPAGYAQFTDVELFQHREIKLAAWGRIEGEFALDGNPPGTIRLHIWDFVSDSSALPGVTHMNVIKTDVAGKFHFDRCVAGRWDEEIVRDPTRIERGEKYVENLTVDVAPGQTVIQHLDGTHPDLVGRINPPTGARVNWDNSFATLNRWEEDHTRGPVEKLPANFREFKRRMDRIALSPEPTFHFRSLEPGEYEFALQVHIPGDRFLHPSYFKKLKITPAMFQGKSADHPIDLGLITLDAASH
jgi:beta-lactamase regulating signal transducer with metallopeptidase domain